MAEFNQFGRYEIRSSLGKGGMATVYLAHDPRFDREVALKVLPREFMHDPNLRERFNREAKTIARLEHYAIVPVYDFGEHDGQLYLVMRYMSGGSLEDRMKHEAMGLTEVASILARVADALDYSHSHGVIHRDLKPGNVMFDNAENAFLSDFGIAKLADATMNLTGSGIIGTSAYMSPEQVKGGQKIDGRSDIYALGVMLFQMLTGEIPYKADTPVQQLMAHVLEPVPSILEAKSDLPPQCENVIAQAMAKERDDRFATAGKLASAVSMMATKEMARPPLPEPDLPDEPEPDEPETAVLTAQEVGLTTLWDEPEAVVPTPETPEPELDEPETAVPIPSDPPEPEPPAEPDIVAEPLVEERPLALPKENAPQSPSRNKWVWVGGGAVLLLLALGMIFLWRAGQRETPVAENAESETTSPTMGDYIQGKWNEGQDVTSLAYGSGVWGVILSDNAALGRQIWHVGGDSPKAFIESKWEEGFDVTSVAYGDGHWVVVLSTEADLGMQLWHFSPDSPLDYMQSKWKEGFDVTSLAYGNGGWGIILSDGSQWGQQTWKLAADSPKSFIESKWEEGFDVTSLAYGRGSWGVVMSSDSDLGTQTFYRTPESPVPYLQDKWTQGLDVTSLAYGEGTWAFVMSDGADLGSQVWHTEGRFR